MSYDRSDSVGHRSPREFLRSALLSGTTIVVPVLLTALVLLVALDVLSSLLSPLAIPISEALGGQSGGTGLVSNVVAFVVLLATILFVGLYSESDVGQHRIQTGVEATMSRLPGVSSIYSPLNRMSDMLLEGDADNFQEVVLVEYPEAGSYSVAFKTATPPETVRTAVDHEDMITVFMPMGPNPFMGGFIMHVDSTQVHDVDLSVEEGITSIVSFGVAVEADAHDSSVSADVHPYGANRPDYQ